MKYNIAYFSPTFEKYLLYLPYAWACLKTYAEQDIEITNNFNWLDPICKDNCLSQLSNVSDKIDILCLSCHIWNNYEIYKAIEIVKKNNPDCFIVMGGPNIVYNDKNYFKKHNDVDVVVKYEGEVSFYQILKQFLHDKDYSNVKGILLNNQTECIDTGHPELMKQTELSPYLENKEYLERIISEYKSDHSVMILWETSRGCLNRCAYCHWSYGVKRMRFIPMKRLKKEIEWFKSIDKKFYIFCVDSNFTYNSPTRKNELADCIIENLSSTEELNNFWYYSENINTENVRLFKKLYNRGVITNYSLGVQHTDDLVLSYMHRQQFDFKNIHQLKGIPIIANLIFGAPGDTLAKWQKCMTSVLEYGVIETTVMPYYLLPNTIMYDKANREKFKIKYINRYMKNVIDPAHFHVENNSPMKIVTSTSTYNTKEWMNMYLFNIIIQTFHIGGIVKYIIEYLRNFKITYFDFYTKLFDFVRCEDNKALYEIFEKVQGELQRFVKRKKTVLMMHSKETNEDIKLEEYFLFQLMTNIDKVWPELIKFFNMHYSKWLKKDLIKYQRNILITEDYTPRDGKKFFSLYDWHGYFKHGRLRIYNDWYSIHQRNNNRMSLNWCEDGSGLQGYRTAIVNVPNRRYDTAIFNEIKKGKTK